MPQPRLLTAAEAASAMRAGDLTSEALVRDCLERIEAREPVLRAWAHLDPAQALAQARARDAASPRGPLHGVPVGIKDIIDTADMPTGHGTPIHAGKQPSLDAACVALLRAAGAVILGKTVSTEFAFPTPTVTRNPHDPDRSPGGSSSGSGAAVADRQVPAALGTQTFGSIMRPASYCGTVGYKPTMNLLSLGGVRPCSQTMDTLGVLCRTVADAGLVTAALLGLPGPFFQPAEAAPRIGFCRTPHWPDVSAEMAALMDRVVALLRAAGAEVTEVELGAPFAEVLEVQLDIMAFEAARNLTDERLNHRDRIGSLSLSIIERGEAMSLDDYRAARRIAVRAQELTAGAFGDHDILLTPSTNAEAPAFGAMADTMFQRLWTILGTPALTLPGFSGPAGLPLGIQLVGRKLEDARLLAAASWVEAVLRREVGPVPMPPE